MTYDVIVVGGSYAGMAAALQLLRARRSVLIVDAGQRRNRFASHSHGFLGQDGADPSAIAAEARAQLMAYPTLTWLDGTATAAEGTLDAFTVADEHGSRHMARRLLFATGVKDALPAIEGLSERWGQSVFHCPYCHGYELDQGAIGVIGTGPASLHQALLLPEWGPTTFLTNGALSLTGEDRAELARRGAKLVETPIARLDGAADVVLTDGSTLSFAGLFTASVVSPATDLPRAMGCDVEENPMGQMLVTTPMKETTVPGVYACGDLARMPHSVSLAVGDGAWAGAMIHRALVFPGM